MIPSIQDVKVKGTSSTDVESATGAAQTTEAERRSVKREILETERYMVTMKETRFTSCGIGCCGCEPSGLDDSG